MLSLGESAMAVLRFNQGLARSSLTDRQSGQFAMRPGVDRIGIKQSPEHRFRLLRMLGPETFDGQAEER